MIHAQISLFNNNATSIYSENKLIRKISLFGISEFSASNRETLRATEHSTDTWGTHLAPVFYWFLNFVWNSDDSENSEIQKLLFICCMGMTFSEFPNSEFWIFWIHSEIMFNMLSLVWNSEDSEHSEIQKFVFLCCTRMMFSEYLNSAFWIFWIHSEF